MIKKTIYTTLFLLLANSIFAQKEIYDPKKTYTPTQLREDFTFLRKCLEESHPGLYWYTPKDSLNQVFDTFAKTLEKDMTDRQFRNGLFPVVAQIRCGHSSLSNSKARAKYLKNSKSKYIPFDVFSIDNQLFVKENASKDSSIKKGTEILQVNGVRSKELIENMANSFLSDGYNKTHKKYIASRHFQSWYPRLNEEKDTFNIVLKDSLLQEKMLNFPAIVAKEFPFERDQKKVKPSILYSNKKVNTFFLDPKNPKIAVLRVGGFTPFGYWKLYRKSFKYLEKNKIEQLVLDLRGNGGGMIFHPGHLLSYLIKEQEVVHIYRSNKKPSFIEKTNGKGKSLRITNRLFPLLPKKTGVTTVKNDSIFDIFLKTKVRKKYHYNGKLYVLIDGGCFSATALTAAFLKKNKRATFIGEETGGGEKGCNAMVMSNLELPNTKLQYRFPFFRVEHQLTPEKVGRGVFPDIYIKYDVKSVLENKDLEMEKVRSLVN
jgi:hypothetical protein